MKPNPLPMSFVFAAALCAPAAAQSLAEGLTAAAVPLPANATVPTALSDGSFAWCDGDDVMLLRPGQPPQSLLHLGAPVFASFLVEVGSGLLLFGEGSTNGLWLVPTLGPAPAAPLVTVALNYDAAPFDAQRAIVSAKAGGFGAADNDLLVVDLATGQLQTIASIPGASGPVAVAANGDLYHATASAAFPMPPGQTSVLRFRRAVLDQALQQSTVLGPADAELVIAGLDVAADLCLDDDGDLLFTDWMQNTVGEIDDATGPSPRLAPPLLAYGSLPGAVTVQFTGGGGSAVFEPFQPPGGALLVFETDFFTTSTLRFVAAERARTGHTGPSPIPAGSVAFTVEGGPANGFALLAIALDTTPGSSAIVLDGFEQPLHWSHALLTPILWSAAFDAQGALAVPVWNPGMPVTAATVQAALLAPNGVLGSSTPATIAFGP